MKIITAVVVLIITILSIFIVLSFSLIKTTNKLEQEAKSLGLAGESISIAKELNSRLLIHNRYSFLYVLSGDEKFRISRMAQTQAMEKLLLEIGELVNGPVEAALLEDVKTRINIYLKKRRQLSDLQLTPDQHYQKISGETDDAIASIDRLVQHNHAQMRELVAIIGRQNAQADDRTLQLLLLGGLLLFVVILMIIYNVVRPLLNLSTLVHAYTVTRDWKKVEEEGFVEIRVLARNFNMMANMLEEKRKDQLQFIASIAHDIRNPLHALSLASDLLAQQSKEETAAIAKVITRQVKNMDRLVSDLMDTLHIESGHLELSLDKVDICQLVREAVALHESSSPIHHINTNIPEHPLFCKGDGGRISQVLNNLLSNALKYSPMGGSITINAWAQEGNINISFTDQGIGIASDDMNNIFKPFQRTKATKGSFPGMGLGLSSSKRIIEAHGGSMTVQSVVGEGSAFFVSIPIESRS